jgi:tRNA pseudouridine32 synthase/23S rRNA pseudouridine746 synthase
MNTEGIIELPLSPSQERLKWKVDKNGKYSKTLWKIRKVEPNLITLVLTPVTGRTHQLRIHLAEVGSGIDGDSLYGDNPETWDPGNATGRRLNLHAEHLSFPHPETAELMEFSSDVSW